MAQKISSSNTKAQLLKAYEELLIEVQEKKQENLKEVHVQKEEAKKVEVASSKNEEGIVKDIANLKLKISEMLDKTGHGLLEEQHQLKEIQDAISIEKKNLKDLYDISVNADTLAALLMAQEEKRRSFDEGIATKENEFNEKMAIEKVRLEVEINQTRADWEKEKQLHTLQLSEDKEQFEKLRKREEEEYKYTLEQNRKKEQDAYDLKKAIQEHELAEKRVAFDKDISEREKVVTEVEQELIGLRKKVEQYPKELEKAIAETEKRVKQQLEITYKFEKDLQTKETEGELKLREQTITTLQEKIKEQESLIKQLSQKADGSEKTVKDIALKAIESTSKTIIVDKENNRTSEERK